MGWGPPRGCPGVESGEGPAVVGAGAVCVVGAGGLTTSGRPGPHTGRACWSRRPGYNPATGRCVPWGSGSSSWWPWRAPWRCWPRGPAGCPRTEGSASPPCQGGGCRGPHTHWIGQHPSHPEAPSRFPESPSHMSLHVPARCPSTPAWDHCFWGPGGALLQVPPPPMLQALPPAPLPGTVKPSPQESMIRNPLPSRDLHHPVGCPFGLSRVLSTPHPHTPPLV